MSSNLTTSLFLQTLRQNGSLPLVFRAQGEIVSPGYHLTEVKRVSYETMDCGGMTHRWSETQFEVWVPPLNSLTPGRGHMPADKFLRIIDRVEQELPLEGEAIARIHASFNGQPAALYDVAAIDLNAGQLWVELVPDRTRCKAAERRVADVLAGCCDASAGASAEPASACCGSEPVAAAAAPSVAKGGAGCCA